MKEFSEGWVSGNFYLRTTRGYSVDYVYDGFAFIRKSDVSEHRMVEYDGGLHRRESKPGHFLELTFGESGEKLYMACSQDEYRRCFPE